MPRKPTYKTNPDNCNDCVFLCYTDANGSCPCPYCFDGDEKVRFDELPQKTESEGNPDRN